MSEIDPTDPLVLITAQIISVPQARSLTEPEARAFFDFIALGCEQMFELFSQLGSNKVFPQVLDKTGFEALRAKLAAGNADPTRVKYETDTRDVVVVVIIRPIEDVVLDEQAIRMGRELAVVHLGRIVDRTGNADLRSDKVMQALKLRIFGNISAFEQMCKLEPRSFRGFSVSDLFGR